MTRLTNEEAVASAVASLILFGVTLFAGYALADDGGDRARERGRPQGRDHECRDEHHRIRVNSPTPVDYLREASPRIGVFIPLETC